MDEWTVERILGRLARIKQLGDGGNEEEAHLTEDRLLVDVLQAIANGANNPAGLAKHALRSQEITYDRWYA